MDQQMRMAKQMIDFQQFVLDGMMSSMIMLVDQSTGMFEVFVDQAPWIPEEGKRAMREWAAVNKKGYETFKSTVDEGYHRIGNCLAGS